MAVSADDYVAIIDHLARYCHAIDEGDENGWVAMWTEDGVFAGDVEFSGRENLKEIVRMVQRRGVGKTRHLVVNLASEYEDADTVRVKYYNLLTSWVDKASIVGLVLTSGALVREGGGWLIKRLDLKMLPG